MMRMRISMLAMALLPATAVAHYPWLTVASLHPPGGEALSLSIPFGDEPGDARLLEGQRILALDYLAADGDLHPIAVSEGRTMRLEDTGPDGVALLAGRQQPGYWSRTLHGGQRAPRSELEDVSHCSHSINGFKALLKVGQGGETQAPGQALGHALELIPQSPAEALGVEAPLRLRLLFEGEALSDVAVTAYALEGQQQDESLRTRSDADGELALALPAGVWMLHAEHSRPYPEPGVCDESRFHTTLVVPRSE